MYTLTSTDSIACLGTSFLSLEIALEYAKECYYNYGICQKGSIGKYENGKYVCIMKFDFFSLEGD